MEVDIRANILAGQGVIVPKICLKMALMGIQEPKIAGKGLLVSCRATLKTVHLKDILGQACTTGPMFQHQGKILTILQEKIHIVGQISKQMMHCKEVSKDSKEKLAILEKITKFQELCSHLLQNKVLDTIQQKEQIVIAILFLDLAQNLSLDLMRKSFLKLSEVGRKHQLENPPEITQLS
jgi:hypothetical protein